MIKLDISQMTPEQTMRVLWESAAPGGPGKIKVVPPKKQRPRKKGGRK